jgi:hypothetical protein
MNERIKQLAEQATSSRIEYDPKTMMTERIQEFDKEKFAELIVQECVKKCDFVAAMVEITNTGEMARKTKATANSCAQMIEEHFGVEE